MKQTSMTNENTEIARQTNKLDNSQIRAEK